MSLKDFEILKTLGSGSFASVYKVKRISDGKEYAMKKVKFNSLKQKEKEYAVNEIRILASINDPNIIGYKEAFYDNDSSCLCIVMEYAGGGDILNKINEMNKKGEMIPEDTIWKYFIQMVKGLKKLHGMKILHRDLKCANIFLSSDDVIKLGDLNVSKVAKSRFVYTQTGTPYYASPEVWKDQPYDGKSDIWSIGCVLYELIALKPPFRAFDMEGLCKKVIKGVYDPIPARYSTDLSAIVALCLNVNPNNRPTCESLFSHPLIQKRIGLVEASQPKAKPNMKNDIYLLETIKMPKDLKVLHKNLPKPNYNPEAYQALLEARENANSNNNNNNNNNNARVNAPSSQQQQMDGNQRLANLRAIPSGQDKRVPNAIENKENNNNKPNLPSKGISIDDNGIGRNNHRGNVRTFRSIAPNKKATLGGGKIRDNGNFQKIANTILNGDGGNYANRLQNPNILPNQQGHIRPCGPDNGAGRQNLARKIAAKNIIGMI